MMNLKRFEVDKPHVSLENQLKKQKLSNKKITNYVKWKPSDMGQLRFDLEVMKWLARDNIHCSYLRFIQRIYGCVLKRKDFKTILCKLCVLRNKNF